MWIMPQTSPMYHYAQDTQGLILDYDAASEQCAQSLLVRSKPMPVQTWSKKWSRDCWMHALFGRILKHSHSENFTAKLTSLVEAFHASHSVQQTQQTGEQTQTQDTYGLTLSEVLNNLHLQSAFLRMSKESTQQSSEAPTGLTLRAHLYCSMFLESWSAVAMQQKVDFSVRLRLEHRIKGKGASSWESEQTSQTHSESTSVQSCSKHHQTNTLTDGLHTNTESSTNGSPPELWRTPCARDWAGYPSAEKTAERKAKGMPISLPNQAHQGTYKGQLNPRWMETLMGLPVGWTLISYTTQQTAE